MTVSGNVISASSDHLWRFVSLEHIANFSLMDRTIHLDTNSAKVLQNVQALARRSEQPLKDPDFHWSIVVDGHRKQCDWKLGTALAHDGLYMVSFGQKDFIVCDERLRCAVAFIGEGMAADGAGFWHPFLSTLATVSWLSLGFSLIPATCLSVNNQGLIVICDEEISDKAQSGISWVCQNCNVVFLEYREGVLRAWNQFWPRLSQHPTEMLISRLSQTAGAYHGIDNSKNAACQWGGDDPAIPSATIFLEECKSKHTSVTAIGLEERMSRLKEHWIDSGSDQCGCAALTALGKRPSFLIQTEKEGSAAKDLPQRLLSLLRQSQILQ